MTADKPGFGSVRGIDIGSVSLSVVQMELSGKIRNPAYILHKGNIRQCLRSLTKDFDLTQIRGIATTTITGFTTGRVHSYNLQVAIIAAAKRLYNSAKSILLVGAEKFMLI